MNIEDFLSKLEKVEADGEGGWMACCPGHDDHNPSMHVNVGADGRILVKCFTGCSTEDIVAGMGLKLKDLMPDTGKASKGKRKASKAKAKAKAKDDEKPLPLVAAPKAKKNRPSKHILYYYYHDEEGSILYRVDRRVYTDEKGGKLFWQFSPDPDRPGYWKFGVKRHGGHYVPYHLPVIRKAAQANRPVVICEGEKDVDNVIKRLNLAATCNPKGAGKWQEGWGKYFEGVSRILIIADKDPETKPDKMGKPKLFAVGQRHACDVERKLRADGYQGEIRKVCLPDVQIEQGVTKKVKDFTDWVEALDAASRKVDKAAFSDAIEQFGQWPDKWKYSDADLSDLLRSKEKDRNTLSSSPVADGSEAEGEEGAKRIDGRGGMGEAGRYGRLCPRAPLKERGWYQVDFQMDPGRIARINVGLDELQFEGWQRSENAANKGEFVMMATYDSIKCPLSRMVSMAIGCMDSFSKNFKLANPQRTELTCMIVLAWLRARGKFFADLDNPMYSTSLYFDSVEGVLYNIQSNEFLSFLATESNVSRENKVFKFMMALIEDLTMTKEETPRIRPSKEWERVGNTIYVSNGDSRMYKVTANKIEDVSNGTDGVVFLRGSTLMPFKLREGRGLDPFVHSMLFKYASLEKQTDVMNCRLWTLNIFRCDQNKPILLVNGPRGSGKTFLLQGIKQIIGIRTDGKLDDSYTKIDATDKGAEKFWIIEDKERFAIFDNLDQRCKWADNDFQVASTGGTNKTRILYTTDVMVTQYPRASFAVTSNNAVFTSEGGGLPDRIIKIGLVGRPKVSKGVIELKADNMANREEYMTFILRTLAAALADTGKVDENINRRHPEFADFAVRCGRAMGCETEAIRALSTAEVEKSVLPLMNDTIAKEIVAVLLAQEKVGDVGFTAGEMADMIIARLDDDDIDDKTKAIYGSRRIGKTIKKFEADFATIFNYSTRVLEGKTKYEFKGLTARGESVVDSLRGGLVGFNADISKNPIETQGRGDLSQNGTENAPNAPYARADVQSSPFTHKEKANRDIGESKDLDDLDF